MCLPGALGHLCHRRGDPKSEMRSREPNANSPVHSTHCPCLGTDPWDSAAGGSRTCCAVAGAQRGSGLCAAVKGSTGGLRGGRPAPRAPGSQVPSHLPCSKPWAAASWGPKARSSERRGAGQRVCPLPWPRISLKARGLRLRATSAPRSTVQSGALGRRWRGGAGLERGRCRLVRLGPFSGRRRGGAHL